MLELPRCERSSLNSSTQKLSALILALSCMVITLGVFVTGSGPHAGDASAPRFAIDPRTISWLHADSVIAMIGLSVGLWFILKDNAPSLAKDKFSLFLITVFAQGFIGYTQYFTKLPEILVAAHMLGATLVAITIWNYVFTINLFTRTNSPTMKS